MSDLPIIMTEAGAQPTPPKTLLSNLISNVAQDVPGYTANLPAALITDLASTAVGALALIDQARVDLVNSLTPYGANIPLLQQLGTMYGVQKGDSYNTSVYMTFIGPPGFVVGKGFVVSDGNYQYSVQTNTVIPSGGQTAPVYSLALESGSWAVPEGSVTQIITSVPKAQQITCTNLSAGLPGVESQNWTSYRSQVMESGMQTVQGAPNCVVATLKDVEGTQDHLLSYRQVSSGMWAVIVGGGDPYDVAYAIYRSVPDISRLTANVVNQDGSVPESKTMPITVYPDVYEVPFVIPSSQNVNVIITWNTASTSYIDPEGVSLAVKENIVDYIDSIAVGQPINVLEIQEIFLESVSGLIASSLVSMVNVQVGIGGVIVPPEADSTLIYGANYGFFSTTASLVQVQKYGSTS